VAEIAARARIHRGNQLEAGREFSRIGSAGDADAAVFQRLTQCLQHAPLLLGD